MAKDMDSLTKQDTINIIREEFGLTADVSRQLVECVYGAMRESVIKAGYLSIKGFGTFTTVERAGRTVNHPATQKPVKIKARKGVRFAMSKSLKDAVAKKGVLPA